MHYGPRPAPPDSLQPSAFTVIVRGHSLSVRSPQLRWIVKGTKGSFVKYGLDPQEDQIKAMKTPAEIHSNPKYGLEDESLWGIIETLGQGDQTVKSM